MAANSDAYVNLDIHDLEMSGGWRRTRYVAVGGLTALGFGRVGPAIDGQPWQDR
jgi:hypothetical protein